jgi:hypothetical protein
MLQSRQSAAHADGCIGVRLGSSEMRQRGRNEDASGKSFLNGMEEVTHNPGLQDVSCCASSQARLNKIGVGMNRQENGLCSAARFAQLFAGIYAAEDWHRNVRNDEIRPEAPRGLN